MPEELGGEWTEAGEADPAGQRVEKPADPAGQRVEKPADSTPEDPAELIFAVNSLAARVRVMRQGAWLPLLLLAAVVLAATPFYFQHPVPTHTVSVPVSYAMKSSSPNLAPAYTVQVLSRGRLPTRVTLSATGPKCPSTVRCITRSIPVLSVPTGSLRAIIISRALPSPAVLFRCPSNMTVHVRVHAGVSQAAGACPVPMPPADTAAFLTRRQSGQWVSVIYFRARPECPVRISLRVAEGTTLGHAEGVCPQPPGHYSFSISGHSETPLSPLGAVFGNDPIAPSIFPTTVSTSATALTTSSTTGRSLYWLIALPLAYVLAALWYALYARRCGIRTRGLAFALSGLVLLAVAVAFSPGGASLLHLPEWFARALPGDVVGRGLIPLLVIALSIGILAYLERSVILGVFAAVFLTFCLMADLYDLTNVTTRLGLHVGPEIAIVVAGVLLLLAGCAAALDRILLNRRMLARTLSQQAAAA